MSELKGQGNILGDARVATLCKSKKELGVRQLL